MSHFDWLIKKEIETLHSPRHRLLYYTRGCLCRLNKDNLGLKVWSYWEPFWNLMGTHWEHHKPKPPPPQKHRFFVTLPYMLTYHSLGSVSTLRN